MIKEIKISGVATYPADHAGGIFVPKKVNFIFGGNGTGKTTISRAIKNHSKPPASPTEADKESKAKAREEKEKYASCDLGWQGRKLEAFVYNRDFIEENFDSDMHGIFTLGKADIKVQEKLDKKREQQASLSAEINKLDDTLADKKKDRKKKVGALSDACWKIMLAHRQDFKAEHDRDHPFQGFMGDKNKLLDKILWEEKENTSDSRKKGELERSVREFFSKTAEKIDPIQNPNFPLLENVASDSLLTQAIVGQEDLPIAGLIKKLNNSDWVNAGRAYIPNKDVKCPFCQLPLQPNLEADLSQYFSEEYEKNLENVQKLQTQYKTAEQTVMSALDDLTPEQTGFLSKTWQNQFIATKSELKVLLEKNLGKLKQKIEYPSTKIKLDGISVIQDKIIGQIKSANEEISGHNDQIDNLKVAKENVKAEIWRFMLEELQPYLKQYHASLPPLDKAISAMETKIEETENERTKLSQEINNLESQIVSVKPTVDNINLMLKCYGFTGFELTIDDKQPNKYKLIRNGQSGDPVHETLSEGEKSFVTFLYFYNLIQGNLSSKDTESNRVVVFDDPVSSMDSGILFVVSAAIRDIIEKVSDGNSQFKQVFVLTHNVFFHKEVSFNWDRKANDLVCFFTVHKSDSRSHIKSWENKNPIKTEYALLWDKVKNRDLQDPALPNIMRRILENYFELVGGVDIKKLTSHFEGQQKVFCQALLSWVNERSHGVLDGLSYFDDPEAIENQLHVFHLIFKKSGHGRHYKMMMGIE